jgi:DNA-nicking Smr family endonuclease
MPTRRSTRSSVAKHGAPTAGAAEDALAFRDAVRDVKPMLETRLETRTPAELARRKKHAPRSAAAAAAAAAAATDDPAESMPLLAEGAAMTAAMGGADSLSFHRAGVRADVLRRLRRGLYPISDELDLHGFSQAAARDSLAQFIAFSRNAGHRCVRVIHGKGYRSGARGPILKAAVNEWLRRHSDVLAFASARPIDGGTGAVYVLLRP